MMTTLAILLPLLTAAVEPAPVLIVTGGNGHDSAWSSAILADLLRDAGKFAVQVTDVGLGVAAGEPHAAAALYDLARPARKVLRVPGAFNRSRIAVTGRRIEHWLNGFPVLSLDLDADAGRAAVAASKFRAMPGFARAARGHVALQDHGDAVRYRSLKVRELPAGGE